jgi:hypothetical protein
MVTFLGLPNRGKRIMFSHFLVLGLEKRVGFGSPVGIKRWYFIKLLR